MKRHRREAQYMLAWRDRVLGLGFAAKDLVSGLWSRSGVGYVHRPSVSQRGWRLESAVEARMLHDLAALG